MQIILFVVVVIASLAWTFYKHKKAERKILSIKLDENGLKSGYGFGYKNRWFAVKTADKHALAKHLKLKHTHDGSWQAGIKHAYKGGVFITPPINGWTLVCGTGLPTADTKEGIDEVILTLKTLSEEFGEAQYFCTHRVTEYHCWMKIANGQVERVYSYFGETGENVYIEGKPTPFEQKLKLANTFSKEATHEDYFEREDIVWPNEELVMQIAAHWSIDPSNLDYRRHKEQGLLGRL